VESYSPSTNGHGFSGAFRRGESSGLSSYRNGWLIARLALALNRVIKSIFLASTQGMALEMVAAQFQDRFVKDDAPDILGFAATLKKDSQNTHQQPRSILECGTVVDEYRSAPSRSVPDLSFIMRAGSASQANKCASRFPGRLHVSMRPHKVGLSLAEQLRVYSSPRPPNKALKRPPFVTFLQARIAPTAGGPQPICANLTLTHGE